VSRFVERILQIHFKVQEQLEKSQQKSKARHDQHREDHKFCIGDKVWLYFHKECLPGASNKLKPLNIYLFTLFSR